jgi:WD40 repeat protein
VIAQVMQGPAARPMQVNPRIAPALDAVCTRAMSRDARSRPAASELAREIERWLADEPLQSYRGTALDAALRWARRHRTGSVAVISVLVATVIGLSIGTVLITRETDAKDLALRDKATALDRAEEQRRLAEKGRLDTRRLLCAAHMRAAIKVWDDGHASRAFELLDAQRPQPGEPDFRGFEWYHLLARMTGARHAELKPETDGVTGAVAFSPDGASVAAGTRDGSASVWDLATRRVRLTLAPGNGARRTWSIAYAPDGATLAVATDDGKVRLWDAATGQLRFVLDPPSGPVTGLCFTPDGDTLATAGDGALALWDLARRSPRATIRDAHMKGNVYCASSGDGATVVTGGADGVVRLWDAHAGAPLRTLHTFSFPVSCVAFSTDGRRLAAGSSWSVTLFDAHSGAELRKVEHMGGVASVAFAPDGSRLASGSGSGQIIITELSTGGQVACGQRHPAPSLCFAPDSRTLASLGEGGGIGLWDVAPAPASLGEPDHPVACAAFVDENTLVAGTRTSALQVFDVRSGALTATLPTEAPVKYVTAHERAPLLCAGDTSGGVSFWDVRTWTRRGHFPSAHAGAVTCADVSRDGKAFVTCDAQRRVRVWDAQTGEPLASLESAGTVAAFAPDGSDLLAVADPSQRIVFGRAGSGAAPEPLSVAPADFSALCFAADGATIAVGTRGGRGLLWDVAADKPVYHLRSEGWSISSILLHPDGRTLVTTNPYGSVQFFDARTGEERATFEVGVLDTTTIARSPSGQVLATIGRDGRVRLWRAAWEER